MPNFYQIYNENIDNCVRLDSEAEYDELSLFKGEAEVKEPLLMHVDEGAIFMDLVGFQDVSNMAVSQSFKDLLISSEAIGFRLYQVSIKGREFNYYGVQVTGRCGELIHPKEPGFYTGVKFDLDSWDGSDIFSPEGTSFVFCTEAIAMELEKAKLTNVAVQALDIKKLYSFGEG